MRSTMWRVMENTRWRTSTAASTKMLLLELCRQAWRSIPVQTSRFGNAETLLVVRIGLTRRKRLWTLSHCTCLRKYLPSWWTVVR